MMLYIYKLAFPHFFLQVFILGKLHWICDSKRKQIAKISFVYGGPSLHIRNLK